MATCPVTLPAAANGELIRSGVSFALLGDVPYGATEEAKLNNVIASINASRNVRFVLHTGDVKGGGERCDDALFIRRYNQFQQFDEAFIITPGDNDWTDCHRSSNGNTLWQFAATTMATVHVVGSANNLATWSGLAGGDRPAERLGMDAVVAKITARTIAFRKPVLLTHGDTHSFQVDKPLFVGVSVLDNFTRVENFGSPKVHWVEVFVDAGDPHVFSVVPRIVQANVTVRP